MRESELGLIVLTTLAMVGVAVMLYSSSYRYPEFKISSVSYSGHEGLSSSSGEGNWDIWFGITTHYPIFYMMNATVLYENTSIAATCLKPLFHTENFGKESVLRLTMASTKSFLNKELLEQVTDEQKGGFLNVSISLSGVINICSCCGFEESVHVFCGNIPLKFSKGSLIGRKKSCNLQIG